MAKDDKLKLLRVGIIQDRRVVEERLLRRHENVSIGDGAKNTFILPGAGLPKSTTLFEARGTHDYALVFERGMEGRIDLGDEPMTLAELARTRHAQKRGNKFVVPMSLNARGKVVLGNVTLLFQFVDAPPVLPRPQLPAAAKGGITSQLEWPLVYILIGSFLLLGGFGTGLDVWWKKTGQYLQTQYERRSDRLYELLNVEVRQEKTPEEKKADEAKVEVKEDPEEAPEAVEEVVETPPEPPKKPTPKPVKEVKKTPQTVAERQAQRAKLTAKVRNTTFLHALGSKGGEDDPLNTLAKGVHAERIATAFDDDGMGVTAATGDESGFVGGPSDATRDGSRYKSLSAGDTGGKRIATQAVKTDKKDTGSEIKVRANIRDGNVSGQTGTGQIDSSAVARVFSRRKGAIKHCYESRLKVNANLRGKVTIRFTIGPAGRVTDISAPENTTNDAQLAQCIIGKVRSWKFEPPQGGSVTFSYPFLLDTK